MLRFEQFIFATAKHTFYHSVQLAPCGSIMATNYCGEINCTNKHEVEVIFCKYATFTRWQLTYCRYSYRLRHSSRIYRSAVINLIGKCIRKRCVLCIYHSFILLASLSSGNFISSIQLDAFARQFSPMCVRNISSVFSMKNLIVLSYLMW